jgi:hypothetical protein
VLLLLLALQPVLLLLLLLQLPHSDAAIEAYNATLMSYCH